MIGSHLIKSYCKQQRVVALSSAEAELYALVSASSEGLGLLAYGKDMGIQMEPCVMTDASAALGNKDRPQTSDKESDAKEHVPGDSRGEYDPVLARWMQQCRAAIYGNWTLMQRDKKPENTITLLVKVGSNGKLGDIKMVKKGDASDGFATSAISAVRRTGQLPPPPARYAEQVAAGVKLTLSAADVR